MNIKYIKKEGFTVTELLVVLAIAAVISVSSFIFYGKISRSNKVQREITDLTIMIKGAESLFTTSATYNGITSKVLIDAGIVPKHKITPEGNAIMHGLGGKNRASRIRTNHNSGDNIKSFGFSYREVPENVCVDFVKSLAPLVDYIAVKGTKVVKPTGQKLNLRYTTEACKNGSSQVYFLLNF